MLILDERALSRMLNGLGFGLAALRADGAVLWADAVAEALFAGDIPAADLILTEQRAWLRWEDGRPHFAASEGMDVDSTQWPVSLASAIAAPRSPADERKPTRPCRLAVIGYRRPSHQAVGGAAACELGEKRIRLTPRETEILGAIAAGASSKEAARRFGISPRTVEVHRARIMAKIGARNTAEMVRAALIGVLPAGDA